MVIGPTGCDGAVSCVKRLLQDCRCGRIKVHCHLVLSAHSRAPPCKLHRFNHNHSKPHHQNQPKFPFVDYNMFKGHRFLGACRHVGGTVKCTGEGGRVPSHRYSNKKHTPFSCRFHPRNEVRTNTVHNPSKAQICTNITITLVTTELARFESRSTSRSCNCASLAPVKSHRL